MPLHIVKNDITKMKVDAIVNAANETLLGGGGVDGCIHRAAGKALLEECRLLKGCETGSAKITGAGNLPAKYVIHAVGPIWRGGKYRERELLYSCYKTALKLADENNCETIAFPLISSGAYGYPKEEALKVAVDAVGEFLLTHDMTVYLVVFDKKSFRISGKLFADIQEYIDDLYIESHTDDRSEPFGIPPFLSHVTKAKLLAERDKRRVKPIKPGELTESALPYVERGLLAGSSMPKSLKAVSLDDALHQIDESFSEMLLRKIDESGMTDSQCYKKANVDRKLFSKIRNDRLYRPSKPTVLAFAIALRLSLDETKDMLMKAGFALSRSNKFDIIIEFFIERGNYDIYEINEALFAFDQSLLGA